MMNNKGTLMIINNLKKCLKPLAIAMTMFAGISTKELSAQIVLEGYVTNVGKNSPATINSPSGVNAGDLLVIGFAIEKGSSETITAP